MSVPARVIVVGSSNTDMIVRTARLPRPGETVLGGAFEMAAGGKGANQAVAAARLGARVTFVARIGRDAFGDAALADFRSQGIVTDHVTRDSDAPSGVALIGVDEGTGENAIIVASGANARLSENDVARAQPAFGAGDVLLCQLETPLQTVAAALRSARTAAMLTILNPAPAQALSPDLLKNVDVLTPNETEALVLTGERTPEDAARQLLIQGAGAVVVTLGANGVLLATSEGQTRLPGLRVSQVVDTTGAGDCFSGALAVGLGEGMSLSDSVAFAQRAAALSVTKFGAQPSLPDRGDVDAFTSAP